MFRYITKGVYPETLKGQIFWNQVVATTIKQFVYVGLYAVPSSSLGPQHYYY
jgi:hypothetical protein